MRVVCDREKFLKAFQTAALFAPPRSPREILQNVRFEADSNSATLTATDLEVGVCVNVEGVDVDKPGVILLPVSHISSLLRESSDEKLTIQAAPRGTIVRGERSEFKLPSADAAEFPEVAKFTEPKYHILTAAQFREIIHRTEFASDLENSRYALGGVLIELDANKIIGVATDGRRLAKVEGPASSVGGHKTGDMMTIIRTQSMRLFYRSLTDADGELHLTVRGNDVLLRTPRATFYSRLVEGRFPRWRDVFPSRSSVQKVPLTTGTFYSSLRQAAIVTTNDSRGIDMTIAAGTLTFTSSTADVGQAQVELPIAYEGPSIVTTLDHKYVNEFLRVVPPEAAITLEMENGETAAVFWADDDRYGYVVMPLSRDR